MIRHCGSCADGAPGDSAITAPSSVPSTVSSVAHFSFYCLGMSYIAREARQELLETVAEAAEDIGAALALVEAAYERLDEGSADRLEEQLFRPLQRALGRARRTHSGFAERHGLEARALTPRQSTHAAAQPRELVEDAADAAADAEERLSELQDSMRPVEVGDAELRAGLAAVRERLDPLGDRAREFLRTFGR